MTSSSQNESIVLKIECCPLHVISRPILRQFSNLHADATSALVNWYRIASKARWSNLTDVQAIFPSAESVDNFTVFDIKGNRYRLIVDINYERQLVFIKYVLTHAEYDKDRWKNDPHF